MLKKEDEEFIDSLKLDKMYKEIKDFFNTEKDINPIKICLVYSPEEFMFYSDRDKFEDWLIGQATYLNRIIIFSPSVVDKYTIHKKEEIKGIIAHEISHLFYEGLKYLNLRLINEGIAEYIMYQFVPREFDIKHLEINDKRYLLRGMDDPKKDYLRGYLLIYNILHQDKGKAKLFEFLKLVHNKDDEETINKKFNIIFGVTPKEFIEMKGGDYTNE